MADSPSVSPLLLLPPEIQRLVLEQLDRESLFNSRRASKSLCYQATPMVFKQLHVWLEEKSLQKLVQIAREPHLRTHVQGIGFGMDAFYDVNYPDFRDVVFPCKEQGSYFPQGKSESSLLKPAWRVYQNYYRKQTALEQSERDLAMIAEAIAQFSSLTGIDLIDFQAHSGGGDEGPRLLEGEKSLRKHMLNISDAKLSVPRGGRQLRILLRALAGTYRKLKELTLQIWTTNISDDGFYSPLSTKDVGFTFLAFGGLKRLGISLNPIPRSVIESCRGLSEDLSLTTILRAATELETLWIELPRNEGEPIFQPGETWKDIIQVPQFGKLKVLSIEGAVLDEAQFVAFLLQSCQGLRQLDIEKATVVEERWDLILETVRDLPRLEKIHLEDLWYECPRGGLSALCDMDPDPLYDYLLKRRDDNPWQEMCQARLAKFEEEDSDTEDLHDEESDEEDEDDS